ncbi:MAG: hypothetical protein ACREXR_21405, partial [Gammaproteobacteria bacterium]
MYGFFQNRSLKNGSNQKSRVSACNAQNRPERIFRSAHNTKHVHGNTSSFTFVIVPMGVRHQGPKQGTMRPVLIRRSAMFAQDYR